MINKLKRSFLILCALFVFFITAFPVHAAELIDRRDECSEWNYNPDGGFEGGMNSASLSCSAEPDITAIDPLDLLCTALSPSVSIRYSGVLNRDIPISSSPIEITYKFDNNISFPEQARYEAALGDWATYKPIDAEIIDAFARRFYVDVTTSETEDTERLPLDGSFIAIKQIKEACLSSSEKSYQSDLNEKNRLK